jgi:ATP-binding cassette subfamily B protein
LTNLLSFGASDDVMPPYHTIVRSLFLIASHHHCHLPPEQLARVDTQDALGSACHLLQQSGLRYRVLNGRTWRDVTALGSAYPVIAIRTDGRWLIVTGMDSLASGGAVVVLDPVTESDGLRSLSRADFLRDWSGTLLLCRRQGKPAAHRTRFGLRWFLPEIFRHAHLFRDIALASVCSTMVGLGTPLIYHVVIDKVVPHHSVQTLTAVVVIFLVATVFDGLFGYMRQILMLHTTNKIDAKLASQTFQRLLSLPLPFFEQMTAGVLARHMQQTEKLRQFLTGRLFQTLLDAAVLPGLLILLALYSFRLTTVVLGFALAIAAVIGVLIPTFRSRLNTLYAAEGDRQAHLVETIHGIRTIKSLAIETLRQDAWNSKVVCAVHSHAALGRIASLAGMLTGGLDRLLQISVLGLGAVEVFDDHISMGALVAFTMLAGRVSGPLVQMVGLIHEYQETALSVKMLGGVMDHPPERDPARRGIRPPISGELTFDDVSFTYPEAAAPALDRVSFHVGRGEVIGVVGRSGSGKTTLTRLIQGIQTNQEGAIRLGASDIRHIELPYLRRAVGVVLQDSFLFRGSIRDNIAATNPHAPLPDIIAAARLAGADEFIDRLPLSYDTLIEEGACNLSGGQRQRLSIARALLVQPRLLIFDEATSALDPDSECVIQDNLKLIASGRSMIIVSHRLSSLVQADAILVLERGRAADFAPHDVLLQRCPIYRHLWHQQTRHIKA